MKTSKLWAALLAVLCLAACFTQPIVAQDENKRQDNSGANSTQAKAPETSKPPAVYRIELTLTEFEDNKKTNSRTYSLLAQTHAWNRLRIGARMPVATTGSPNMPAQFQYMDIGTNIDCNIEEEDGLVLLNTTVDVTGMAPQREEQTHQPIIRQMKSELRTVLTPGKPTVINSNDDPSGKARFQLEATATKIR